MKDDEKKIMDEEIEDSEQDNDEEFENYEIATDSEYPYFNLPASEPDRTVHPKMQKTYHSINYKFPSFMRKITIGIVLIIIISIIQHSFMIRRYSDMLSPIEGIELRAQYDTQFNPISRLEGSDELTIPRGTVLKPIAAYRNQYIVQLPDGQRGIVNPIHIDKYYNTILVGNVSYFEVARGGQPLGTVPVGTELTGRNLVSLDELAKRRFEERFPIQLADGRRVYVDNRFLDNELRRYDIPYLGGGRRKTYTMSHLRKSLLGVSGNDIVKKLRPPIGIQSVPNSRREYYLFHFLQIVEDGVRYPRLALEVEGGIVKNIIPQGEKKTTPIDRHYFANFLHSTRIANVMFNYGFWQTLQGFGVYESILPKSKFLAIVVSALFILFQIGIFIIVLIGLFGLPILLTKHLAILLGKYTPLSNTLITFIIFILMAIFGYLFFAFSLIAFNLEFATFWLVLYGILLFFFYIVQAFNISDYLDSVRCKSCKGKGRVRDIGSVYLGSRKDVVWYKAYVGTKVTETTITDYYEWRKTVFYNYFYDDYYGCKRCGSSWSLPASNYKKRSDMLHE